MAVTKFQDIDKINLILAKNSINLIGESRWQEAKDKLPLFPAGIEKHFIGHLQSNKAKEVVEAFDAIESVDSEKLLRAIDAVGKPIQVFLQVNISHDQQKFGFAPEELDAVLQVASTLKFAKVVGLMTITAKQSIEATRADFKKMKALQTQFGLPELSMGMSDDYEIAIEEGATIVRLGTALFGERAY